MVGVYDDDALLAMWLRAGWICLERHADETNDVVLVSRRDLGRIAATTPWVNVQRKLLRLVAATPLRVRCECAAGPLRGRCDCAALSLEFPNFAKIHTFHRNKWGTHVGESESESESESDVPLSGSREPAQESLEPPDPEPHGQKPEREPSPEAQAAFDLLLWAITESTPGASVPEPGSDRWRRWCEELDRLHRLGEKGGKEGFPWETILNVIRWLPTHRGSGDFAWGMVIRSAAKLRQHFARLLAEARLAAQPAPTRSGGWRAAARQVQEDMTRPGVMETGDG